MSRLLSVLSTMAALFSCSGLLPASDLVPPETRVVTLQEAVRLALERSPEVLMAKSRAVRAGEAVREAGSLNQPQVSAGTGLAYNNGFPLSIEGSAPSIFRIVGNKSLFSSKNANLIKESRESARAGEFAAESVRNDMAAKTALCYSQLHRSHILLSLAERKAEIAESRLQAMESLLDAGKVRPIDAMLVRTSLAAARQEIVIAREEARVLETELRTLTGIPDSISIKTREPRIESPIYTQPADALFQQTVATSPEIQQAEAVVKSKEFHIGAEKGERHPRIDFVSQYALLSRSNKYEDYYNDFERHNYLVGLSIQVPLFTGSRTGARIAQSRQEVMEERYRLESLKSELRIGIQRGLSGLEIARGAVEFARRDLEAAIELERLNGVLLAKGRISGMEMADARLQQHQKEHALVEAEQTLMERKLDLLRIAGTAAGMLVE